MSVAGDVRRDYAEVIARAEQRAVADVELGIVNLRAAIDAAEWPWERQVLEGHLARIEAEQ